MTASNKYRTYLLNSIAGLFTAFQSVLILVFLARICSLAESGIYTFAYATANLFFMVGKYGMRNYQVSDIRQENSFSEYVVSRLLTCFAMLLLSILYPLQRCLSGRFSIDKTLIIIAVCIWKAADAFGDVYYGQLQKKDRLDLAAISIILRFIAGLAGFLFLLFLSRSLLYASIAGCILSWLFLFLTLYPCRKFFSDDSKSPYIKTHKANVLRLLNVCFPLLVCSFFSFYLGNAPKYAINRLMDDEAQAIYGYLAMPVFIIELLNGFILQPVLVRMSYEWNNGCRKQFAMRILKQILVITGLTVTAVTGAAFLGIPVLSFLYHYDLQSYRTEMLLLLTGGGFLAITGLFVTALTIMRQQRLLMGIYTLNAAAAYLLSDQLIRRYQLMGASVSYLVMISGLSLAFAVLCWKCLLPSSLKA